MATHSRFDCVGCRSRLMDPSVEICAPCQDLLAGVHRYALEESPRPLRITELAEAMGRKLSDGSRGVIRQYTKRIPLLVPLESQLHYSGRAERMMVSA